MKKPRTWMPKKAVAYFYFDDQDGAQILLGHRTKLNGGLVPIGKEIKTLKRAVKFLEQSIKYIESKNNV